MTATKTTKRRSNRALGPVVALALCSLVWGQSGHATLAGTVFRDPGFAQAGATVVLARKEAPNKKVQQVLTDRRGEYAFRVPPGPAVYIVSATLKGFKPARQEFQVAGEEQINATLLLIPESKK